MCKKCVKAVNDVYPEKKGDLEFLDFVLWNKTAFPFAKPSHIKKQLLELKARGTK